MIALLAWSGVIDSAGCVWQDAEVVILLHHDDDVIDVVQVSLRVRRSRIQARRTD
jgi:hypothetical protein